MSRPPNSKNTAAKPLSQRLWGIVLVLLSAVFLAAQNVISRLFFVPALLLGQIQLGGWLPPQFSNITLLLALRMALMAGLLSSVASRLYPGTFSDLKKLNKNRRLLSAVIGSGACLFVGLIALYFSLSQVVAGVAIATFFIYPAVTLLLAWRFLQQRPERYQISLVPVILFGVVLTTLGTQTNAATSANTTLGILSGLIAGLSFGFYGIFAEVALQPSQSTAELNKIQTLHPVPFSLLTFIVVSALGVLSLFVMPPVNVAPTAWQPILLTTLISALITVIAYVLNNSGIRLIGASLTALISASTPALTALFAWFILQESLSSQQILGVILVTIGIAILSARSKQQ